MSVNGILKINPNVKYICIGSLVPFFAISQNPRIFNKKNGIKLIQYVMSIIPKHIKVHALGLSINNFPFLVKLGIHSADSTSPFLSSLKANFMFKDRWTMTYLKSSQYNSLHTNSFGQKLLYNKFRDCQCPPCSEYKPEQVAQKFVDFRKSDFDARAKRRVHNGWIYQSMYADEVRLFEEGKYFKTIIPQYKYKNAYHSIFNKSMLM